MIAVLAFGLVMAIVGIKKGFMRMVLSTGAALIAALIVWFMTPVVKDFVKKNTQLDEKLNQKVYELLENRREGSSDESTIDGLNLPSRLTDKIKDSGGYLLMDRWGITEKIGDIIISAGAAVALFILSLILVRLLIKVTDLVNKLPVIHQLNGVLGAAAGLLEAWLILNVIFVVLTVFVRAEWANKVMLDIQNNPLTKWLYEHNFLLKILS